MGGAKGRGGDLQREDCGVEAVPDGVHRSGGQLRQGAHLAAGTIRESVLCARACASVLRVFVCVCLIICVFVRACMSACVFERMCACEHVFG